MLNQEDWDAWARALGWKDYAEFAEYYENCPNKGICYSDCTPFCG